MHKMAHAMAHPQEYEGEELNLKGLVLVCYVSVEDQDTFDPDIISNQAANTIVEAIQLIEGFPAKLAEKNEEVRQFNAKLEKTIEMAKTNPKIPTPTDKPKETKNLILDPSKYKVDKILVYPWAHLSNYLSNEASAADVCPKIAALLKKKGYESYFSPFGWYKAFKIECLGHEVAEMFRDIKLAVLADEVRATSRYLIITQDRNVIDLCPSDEEAKKKMKIPDRYKGKEWKDFQDFVKSEVMSVRKEDSQEPPHIGLMKKFEIADFEEASDAGNLRWYTRGVVLKECIRDYVQHLVTENGAIYVDTPVMYTVKNKKLTAQTARFPAKTYWVNSGNNRFLLRFASDFLLFNLFSQMPIREEQLPIPVYEYEQYAFRREQAGELSGLRRLRAFTMPDLHTMCADLPQAVTEFKKQFIMDNQCLSDMGLNSYMIIRTTEDFWKDNQGWIMDIIEKEGRPALLELWPERYYYFILKYERAVLDANGHTSTLATIQLDVESAMDKIVQYGKERTKYDIRYKKKDGSEHHPIILHNSPSGGLERAIWALLETNIRNQDKLVTGFKFWLSPIQVRVMAISDKENSYAEEIMKKLSAMRIRCDFDDRDETAGKKIRQAEIEWIPYTIVIGSKELAEKKVSIRKRRIGQPLGDKKETADQINDISFDEFVKMIDKEMEGFPRHELPIPFRYYSKRIYFR
jgi:threonyl-tRNA synthetase